MTGFYAQSQLQVLFGGVELQQIFAAQTRHSVREGVSEARVVLATYPTSGTYNDFVTITGGRGHNIQRFQGYLREVDDELFPGRYTLLFKGELVKAAEYENWEENIRTMGGLGLIDLVGGLIGSDAQIVAAVLAKTGVNRGPINGTGRQMGINNVREWVWLAGTPTDVDQLQLYREKGQMGLDYIREIDRISATPDGFYTTYDTPTLPRRTLIGGHPAADAVLTFTEGVDILRDSKYTRGFPIANAVLAKGFDRGLGTGPVADFYQGGNAFMPTPIVDTYSSPLIEHATESDASAAGDMLGIDAEGMSCEIVRQARYLDVNREPVSGSLTTYRDDLIIPGDVHLVQGPGGAPGRLRVGEKLWCVANTCEWARRGSVLVFRQRPEHVGGGL